MRQISLVHCVHLVNEGAFSLPDLDKTKTKDHMATTAISRAGFGDRGASLPPANLIFGRSAAMQKARQKIDKVALSGVPILVQGDNGTGKGLLASFIHHNSPEPGSAFVKVNCAAIPGALLESELFGYEKGAFTGAHSAKPGRVELADGGTLFLDGINEIDMSLQAKLLQLLQDGQYYRIGGQEERRVRVRLICATNRRLELEIANGRFRQDLYYRINVVSIELPPLRSRTEDIPDLVAYFLQIHKTRHNMQARPLSASALQLLSRHSWPGNIRELENLIERYVILGSEDAIFSELLNREHGHETPEIPVEGQIHLKKVTRQAVHDLERKIILSVLEANHWNRKRTASALKISYRALLYKIRRAGLPRKRGMHPPKSKTVQPTATED
jgi:two-component system response regulator AtoC